MHIIEGYLPMVWCLIWFILSIIVIVVGCIQLKKLIAHAPDVKKFLAINGIVMFFASLIFSIPSLNGCRSSVPFNALSGSVLGPAITSVVVAIVLLLQAFILGYGGLTTLGANIFAMGVVGPLAACLVYHYANKFSIPNIISLILAVIFANLFTILTTAVQYGLVFGDIYKFFVILFVGQIPMLVIDIILTVGVYYILTNLLKGSEIFSLELDDFFKIK